MHSRLVSQFNILHEFSLSSCRCLFSDPILNSQVLAANLGCSVPYYFNPYFRSSAMSSLLSGSTLFVTAVCALLCMIQFLFM